MDTDTHYFCCNLLFFAIGQLFESHPAIIQRQTLSCPATISWVCYFHFAVFTGRKPLWVLSCGKLSQRNKPLPITVQFHHLHSICPLGESDLCSQRLFFFADKSTVGNPSPWITNGNICPANTIVIISSHLWIGLLSHGRRWWRERTWLSCHLRKRTFGPQIIHYYCISQCFPCLPIAQLIHGNSFGLMALLNSDLHMSQPRTASNPQDLLPIPWA